MLIDLEKRGYEKSHIISCIREKAGAYLHDIEFNITGERAARRGED
ncbi:MAG: hypothetical protein ACE5DM_00585 [Candidatus Nanoarchaeia archaeon]